MFASVAGEVSIVAVDHRQAGAHEARQFEDRDASTEGEGRVGVSQVVGPANRVDPGGELSWSPLAARKL